MLKTIYIDPPHGFCFMLYAILHQAPTLDVFVSPTSYIPLSIDSNSLPPIHDLQLSPLLISIEWINSS